jgi:hypothetical protein
MGMEPNRSQRRNIYPSTALGNSASVTSQTEKLTVGKGIRFYVYCSSTTQGTGSDTFSLVAVPPDGNADIVLGTFSGTHMLSTTGGVRLVFDFYPGETGSIVPASGITFAAGAEYGAAAISPPMQYAVQLTLSSSSAATIAVDSEILP